MVGVGGVDMIEGATENCRGFGLQDFVQDAGADGSRATEEIEQLFEIPGCCFQLRARGVRFRLRVFRLSQRLFKQKSPDPTKPLTVTLYSTLLGSQVLTLRL